MAIDPERFYPGIDGQARRRELESWFAAQGLPTPTYLIGYVGSFNHYHRPGWLVDLAVYLKEKQLSARLVVIGGTPEKIERQRQEAQRRGVLEWFHHLGPLPHEQLPEWMSALDLLVVPGAAPQSSPTKIIEGAALGIPQVAPDLPSVRRILGKGDASALFSPDNLAQFCEKVARALEQREIRRQKAAKIAQVVLREHTWKRRAEEIVARASCP